MERYLKHAAAWGALTAFWCGVLSEAIMTCAVTTVCAPPGSFAADAVLITFFAHMTWTAVRAAKNHH